MVFIFSCRDGGDKYVGWREKEKSNQREHAHKDIQKVAGTDAGSVSTNIVMIRFMSIDRPDSIFNTNNTATQTHPTEVVKKPYYHSYIQTVIR